MHLPRQGRYWLLSVFCLLGIGWLTNINVLLLLAYIMLVLWGINFLLAGRRLGCIEARRRIDGPVFAQTPFAVRIEVFNPQRRPLFGFRIEDKAPSAEASWFVVQLPGLGTLCFERQSPLPSRGATVWRSRTPGTSRRRCRRRRTTTRRRRDRARPEGLALEHAELGGPAPALEHGGTAHAGRNQSSPSESSHRLARRLPWDPTDSRVDAVICQTTGKRTIGRS